MKKAREREFWNKRTVSQTSGRDCAHSCLGDTLSEFGGGTWREGSGMI